MKTTVTTNDGLVRLRIYEGNIPADAYHQEMLELERGQHAQTRIELEQARARIKELERADAPSKV